MPRAPPNSLRTPSSLGLSGAVKHYPPRRSGDTLEPITVTPVKWVEIFAARLDLLRDRLVEHVAPDRCYTFPYKAARAYVNGLGKEFAIDHPTGGDLCNLVDTHGSKAVAVFFMLEYMLEAKHKVNRFYQEALADAFTYFLFGVRTADSSVGYFAMHHFVNENMALVCGRHYLDTCNGHFVDIEGDPVHPAEVRDYLVELIQHTVFDVFGIPTTSFLNDL